MRADYAAEHVAKVPHERRRPGDQGTPDGRSPQGFLPNRDRAPPRNTERQLSAILFASTTCKQSMPKMGGLSVQGGSPVFGAIINLHLDLRQR